MLNRMNADKPTSLRWVVNLVAITILFMLGYILPIVVMAAVMAIPSVLAGTPALEVPDVAVILSLFTGAVLALGGAAKIAPRSGGPRRGQSRPATRDDSSVPACDRCGHPMVMRTNRRDGSRFFGCSTFPNCKNTLPT